LRKKLKTSRSFNPGFRKFKKKYKVFRFNYWSRKKIFQQQRKP